MAGANDFTGKFISSTYQRVLQISGSGEITDGTGSLVDITTGTVFNAFTSSYYVDSASFDFRITSIGNRPPIESDPIFTAKEPSLATTGSNVFIGTQIITGSLETTQGITGSFTGQLIGTASWAENASTASYILASNIQGPTGTNSILSSSYALTASYVSNAGVSDNLAIAYAIALG